MSVPSNSIEVIGDVSIGASDSTSIVLDEDGEIKEIKAPSGTSIKIKKNVVTQPENPETAATLSTSKGTDASTGFAQQLSQQ